jgi:SAM-dependent methyltransferase
VFPNGIVRKFAGPFRSTERSAAQVESILTLLALHAGTRVHDPCCEHGRHLIPLTKRGYAVTGYDLCQLFLERARAEAKSQGAGVR